MVDLTFKVLKIFIIFGIGVLLTACGNDPKKGEKLYREGKYQKALPLLEAQCIQGEVSACKMSASIFFQENKVINRLKALKALQFACKYGDTPSCEIIVPAYQKIGDQTIVMQALQWGCQGGNPKACLTLGQEWLAKKDSSKALRALIKSCYGGEKRGCQIASSILQKTNPKSPQIQELLRLSQDPL